MAFQRKAVVSHRRSLVRQKIVWPKRVTAVIAHAVWCTGVSRTCPLGIADGKCGLQDEKGTFATNVDPSHSSSE